MRIIAILTLLISNFTCFQPVEEIEYSHKINRKCLPVNFTLETGRIMELNKGYSFEMLGETAMNWKVKILINDKVKTGTIPKLTENGHPIIIVDDDFKEQFNQKSIDCYEVKLPPKKALTLRKRPLNEEELAEMIRYRNSQKSIQTNLETAILGISSGVRCEMLNHPNKKWYKIRITYKNLEHIGFISKDLNGVNTLIDYCF